MPCGNPRDAARKYPADTRTAPIRDGAKAQSAGNRMAIGSKSGSPLQPTIPIATAAAAKATDKTMSRTKGEDGMRAAEETGQGEALMAARGKPRMVVSDNGTEFTSNA